MKATLRAHPYFTSIPGFAKLGELFASKLPAVRRDYQKAVDKFQKTVDRAIEDSKAAARISCFSKRNNSMLMWSHYADSHKGVCIEYDVPEPHPYREVIYQKKRPSMKLYRVVSHIIAKDILKDKTMEPNIDEMFPEILDPFCVKSDEWSYEEELRILCNQNRLPEDTKYIDGKPLWPMPVPSAIFIGCKAPRDELETLVSAAEQRGIPIFHMRASSSTFEVVVDEHIGTKRLAGKTN